MQFKFTVLKQLKGWSYLLAMGYQVSSGPCLELATSQLKGTDQSRPRQLLMWMERSNGDKLKHRRPCLNIRKHFVYYEGDQALEYVAQGGCGVSLIGVIKKTSGHSPG